MDIDVMMRDLAKLKERVEKLEGSGPAPSTSDDSGPGETNQGAGAELETIKSDIVDLLDFKDTYEPMLEQSYGDWIKYLKANNMPLPDGYVEPEQPAQQAQQPQQEQPANPTQAETPPA